MGIERVCKYVPRLINSLVIGFGATFLSVFLGTLAVYGFSRFRVPLKNDLLFFILSAALYPHMNVRENTGFPLRCIGALRAEIWRRVEEASRLLRIDHLLESLVGRLAAGDRQRLALGRAIARWPKAFLTDEPLSSLDAAFGTRQPGIRPEDVQLDTPSGIEAGVARVAPGARLFVGADGHRLGD